MNKKQIVDKIQKLLALASSSNENEAKTAASMAQSLLVKYNLTMTDVEEDPEQKYHSEFVDTGRQRFDPAWKFIQSLLRDFFFVEIVQTKKRVRIDKDTVTYWDSTKVVNCYVMFGQPHNVEIAKYIRDFLMRSFAELFKDYRKRTGAELGSRNSFYMGLFSGLHEQLKTTRQKVENETGLVVVEDADLKDFIDKNLGKVKSSPSKYVVSNDSQAMAEGYEAGKNLSIARGLGGGSESKKEVGQVLRLGGK